MSEDFIKIEGSYKAKLEAQRNENAALAYQLQKETGELKSQLQEHLDISRQQLAEQEKKANQYKELASAEIECLKQIIKTVLADRKRC